jgi:hypothetical protein
VTQAFKDPFRFSKRSGAACVSPQKQPSLIIRFWDTETDCTVLGH